MAEPIIAVAADGTEHEFPAGTDTAVVDKAMADYAAMRSPQATAIPGRMQQQIGRRAMRAIPYATGMLGAMAGGIPGATIGGMIGKGAELGMAGELPKTPAQGVQQIGGAGVEQGLLQLPAEILGLGAGGLIGIRNWARNRAVNQAIKEEIGPLVAGLQAREADLATRVPAATAARRTAAQATAQEIGAGNWNTTIKDLADEVIADRMRRFPNAAPSPKVRAQIINDIKLRVAQVMPKHTGRLISGKQLVFDAPTSQIGKQAFDELVKAAHTGAESGIKPRPAIDMDIANAWRSIIERKAPKVGPLNEATRAALKTEQSLKKMQKAIPTKEALAVKLGEKGTKIRTRVLSQRSANPIQVMRGLVRPGQFVTPGLGYRPGTLAEFGGKMGELFQSAPAEQTAFYGPRGIAALLELLRQQESPPPQEAP